MRAIEQRTCLFCTQASSAPGLVSQISFSSVDYTVEGEDAEVVQSPDQISVISAPVVKTDEPKAEEPKADSSSAAPPKEELPTLGYCFPLYDYDAESGDELNLEEGQVRVLFSLRSLPRLLPRQTSPSWI